MKGGSKTAKRWFSGFWVRIDHALDKIIPLELSLSVCHSVVCIVFWRISVCFRNFGFQSFLFHRVEVLQSPSDDLISDFFFETCHILLMAETSNAFLPDRFFSKLNPNPANYQSQTAGRKQRWRILRPSLWQIQLIVWERIGRDKAPTLQTKHDVPALMHFLKCLFSLLFWSSPLHLNASCKTANGKSSVSMLAVCVLVVY